MTSPLAANVLSPTQTAAAAVLAAEAPATFHRAIHAQPLGPDIFQAQVTEDWNVIRGPNGGYLAALLLQTMLNRLDDAERRPRVLSVHYPKVPVAGPVEIRTQLSRAGRSMSWLSAELWQDDALCVSARAAFSADWPSLEYDRMQAPVVSEGAGLTLSEGLPPFSRHFEYRSLFATPISGHSSEAVGGYIRLRQPEPYSAALLAALADAWFPSTFAFDRRPTMAATLDLTVHFRDHAALAALDPAEPILSVFRSRLATQGFFEEDGELWSRGGKLIAQSRQLAIAAPYSRRPA